MLAKIIQRDLVGATITEIELDVRKVPTETGHLVDVVSVLALKTDHGIALPMIVPTFEGPATATPAVPRFSAKTEEELSL